MVPEPEYSPSGRVDGEELLRERADVDRLGGVAERDRLVDDVAVDIPPQVQLDGICRGHGLDDRENDEAGQTGAHREHEIPPWMPAKRDRTDDNPPEIDGCGIVFQLHGPVNSELSPGDHELEPG